MVLIRMTPIVGRIFAGTALMAAEKDMQPRPRQRTGKGVMQMEGDSMGNGPTRKG